MTSTARVAPSAHRSRCARSRLIFALGWNLMHVIDESSPRYGETSESVAACEASLVLMIEGRRRNDGADDVRPSCVGA